MLLFMFSSLESKIWDFLSDVEQWRGYEGYLKVSVRGDYTQTIKL